MRLSVLATNKTTSDSNTITVIIMFTYLPASCLPTQRGCKQYLTRTFVWEDLEF